MDYIFNREKIKNLIMDFREMRNIDKITHLKEFGMTLHNGTTLIPVKSCAGLYFKVNDKYRPLDGACADCLGTSRSCKLCQRNGGQ